MNFTLNQTEVELLRRVLPHYVSELRMEIAGTDSYDMRQQLKGDEEILKSLLVRLGQVEQSRS